MPKKKANEILYTNIEGAARILNRTRQTISSYIKNGHIGHIARRRNILISIADIANKRGCTYEQAKFIAKTLALPLWTYKSGKEI